MGREPTLARFKANDSDQHEAATPSARRKRTSLRDCSRQWCHA